MKKPKITDINTNTEQLQVLEPILKTVINSTRKRGLIKKYSDGLCFSCDALATKKLVYDIGDATIIERYCDKHFPKQWSKKKK